MVDSPPFIFTDSLAEALLGDRAGELTGYHSRHASHPILSSARAQVLCRSRYTEDHLCRAPLPARRGRSGPVEPRRLTAPWRAFGPRQGHSHLAGRSGSLCLDAATSYPGSAGTMTSATVHSPPSRGRRRLHWP